MNIFALDTDPKRAAIYCSDRHIPALHREAGILLCNGIHPVFGAPLGCKSVETYERVRKNKLTRWIYETRDNFDWTMTYLDSLIEEHCFRFHRDRNELHANMVYNWILDNDHFLDIQEGEITPFALAVSPDLIPHRKVKTVEEAVAIYRRYYVREKWYIARYEKGRKPPYWFSQSLISPVWPSDGELISPMPLGSPRIDSERPN
jgi:hypothetical protein